MVRRLMPLRRVGLAVFLLVHAIFYSFMGWADYMFVPAHEALQVGLLLAIIVALTIDGVRCRREQTSSSSQANAILPVIALFFVITMVIAHDSRLYFLLSLATLVCSLILFFACTRSRIVKIVLGVIYVLGVGLLSFALYWLILFSAFSGEIEVRQSEVSPDGTHLAQVIENSGVGMSFTTITRVDVSRRDRDVNILVGVFRPIPQRIYAIDWNIPPPMTLYWEADEVLYITYTSGNYDIIMRFERQGNDWRRLDG